jgi:hypothetical protein
VRPLLLVLNCCGAGEFETRFSDTDAVAQSFAVLLHQIEKSLARIDDDRSDGFTRREIDNLPEILWIQLRDINGLYFVGLVRRRGIGLSECRGYLRGRFSRGCERPRRGRCCGATGQHRHREGTRENHAGSSYSTELAGRKGHHHFFACARASATTCLKPS